MALQIISDNSKIGTGVQVNLGAADDGFVTAGVTVASTDFTGISSFGSNQNLNVQGTVVGAAFAIDLGDLMTTGQHLTIGENGYAGNSSTTNAAVIMRGTGNTVDNAGTIDGEVIGLETRGAGTAYTSVVNNTGLIEASDIGVFRTNGLTNDQKLVFNNTGEVRTIASNGAAYFSFAAVAVDEVTNSGLLVGNVVLGEGQDKYDGSAGGRVLGDVLGAGGQDQLRGGDFADRLFGGAQDDGILGGGGDDRLEGDAGQDSIGGGDGNDFIKGGDDNDQLWGDAGIGSLDCGVGSDTLSGGDDRDFLAGGADDDTLNGDAGNDTLLGDAGKDTMSGGLGDDELNGGTEDDTMFGDAGNDTLNGGSGIDNMDGGAGNDTLNGGAGADSMDGGAGNDSFVVDNASDVVIDFGGGIDTVLSAFDFNLASPADAKGSVEKLSLTGTGNINGTGNALANTLIGNIGNNILKAGAGNDIVVGGNGNDRLFGEAGNDVLNGGAGTDKLYGGLGKDIMTGGTQADQFAFDTKPNAC